MIPVFGNSSTVAQFGIAGSPEGDSIPGQSQPVPLEIPIAFQGTNTVYTRMCADAEVKTIDRTFVIQGVSANTANKVNYAFIGRIANQQIDPQIGAETKATITIARRGGQRGWSFV